MNVNIEYLWLTIALSALIPTMSVSVPALASSRDTLSITGNGDTAAMALKFDGGQDTRPVRGFVLTADNVLQIQEGQTVRITNDVDFDRARTTDVNDNDKDIRISNNGEISFSGYPKGIYVLNVVVGDKAYECIIVIGEESQDVINKEINKINTRVKIIVDIDIDEDCSDEQGSAGLKFPFNKKSECQVLEYQECQLDKLQGIKWDDRCKDINHGFEDDCDIPGVTNKEQCDEYWNNLPVVPPYCDEFTVEGTVCRDEGEESTPLTPPVQPVCPPICGPSEEVPEEPIVEEPTAPEEPTVDTGETEEFEGENLIEDVEETEEVEEVPEDEPEGDEESNAGSTFE